ncbi:MAG: response regulator [Clostridia bacterium]
MAEKRTILVADDDPDAVETLSLLLSRLGHRVFSTTRAGDVLSLATLHRPQLILLDISMPDLDGWQLARSLRGELGYERVRIIAVSGRVDSEDYRRSRESGFDAHVPKPVDLALVQSMLEQVQ